MKYLAALVIWIGLMTSSQAFAHEYLFKMDEKEPFAPLRDCEKAAQNGIELSPIENDNFGDVDIANKRYLHQNKVYLLMVGLLEPTSMVLRCFLLKPDEIILHDVD